MPFLSGAATLHAVPCPNTSHVNQTAKIVYTIRAAVRGRLEAAGELLFRQGEGTHQEENAVAERDGP